MFFPLADNIQAIPVFFQKFFYIGDTLLFLDILLTKTPNHEKVICIDDGRSDYRPDLV